MKKIILITLFTLLGLTQAVAQEYEYVPFVREGVKWECSCFNFLSDLFPYGVSYYTLEMKGDTVIDGKHYKPVHLYSGESINEENDTVPVYLREEDKVVYAYIPDGRRYVECPVGIGQTICGYDIDWAWSTGEEHILYDFNDMAGFYDYLEETSGGWVWGQVYQGSDMVMVSDRMVKRYKFRSDSEFNKYTQYIIEGLGYIGIDGMPLSYFQWETTGMQNGYHLERVIEDGQVIYENGDFPFEYNYVPFVREGVKWVYYYYNGNDYYPANPNLASGMVYLNLEFKGDTVINGKTYKAMHKYYGEAINEENDTIPIYMREEGKVVYAIVPDCKFYLDCPIGNYEGSAEDFNAMEQGREFVLYDFSDPVAYWNQAFNQAWTVAVIAGILVMLLVFFAGVFLYDVSLSLPSLLAGIAVSGLLAGVYRFFVFHVDYSRTEYTQFEDDEYFYYVKAVPKVTVTAPAPQVRKISTARKARGAGKTARPQESGAAPGPAER